MDVIENVECEKRPTCKGKRKGRAELAEELAALKSVLHRTLEALQEDGADLAKLAATASRLTDSITRAALAQRRLSPDDEGVMQLRSELDRVLRSLGLGEE